MHFSTAGWTRNRSILLVVSEHTVGCSRDLSRNTVDWNAWNRCAAMGSANGVADVEEGVQLMAEGVVQELAAAAAELDGGELLGAGEAREVDCTESEVAPSSPGSAAAYRRGM
jgi:hypothetical protein